MSTIPAKPNPRKNKGKSKLHPGVKECWTQALRSGRYKPGRGALCKVPDGGDMTGATYCCLGVLAAETGRLTVDMPMRRGLFFDNAAYLKNLDMGLHYEDQGRLAVKNDGGDSFEEIADWIEENL